MPATVPTFADLVAVEPALGQLLATAKAYRKNVPPKFCANAAWYGYGNFWGRGLKARLSRLVGWDAAREELRTEEAYDLAYDTIYRALPNCRKCGCC
jgi:hypothetical protein